MFQLSGAGGQAFLSLWNASLIHESMSSHQGLALGRMLDQGAMCRAQGEGPGSVRRAQGEGTGPGCRAQDKGTGPGCRAQVRALDQGMR